MMREAVKLVASRVTVPVASGGRRSGFVPWHSDVRVYVPGKRPELPERIPPVYVSHGAGAVTLSPPQATAAAASTMQHDQSFIAPPLLSSDAGCSPKRTMLSAKTTEPPGNTRRLCVTLLRDVFARRLLLPRRPAGSNLTLQDAVLATVAEVDPEADHEPYDQTDPRVGREKCHQRQARSDPENRHERHPRRPEGSVEVGPLMTQDPHTPAHQHKCEQRADVHELAENPDREQPGEESHADAGVNRGEIRRAEPVVDLPRPVAQQAVARHRIEDP